MNEEIIFNSNDVFENMDEMVKAIETMFDERKFQELKELLGEIKEADIALLFEEVKTNQIPVLFRLLDKEDAADIFVRMSSDLQKFLIDSFSDKELEIIIDDIFVDDTVDIIEEMPANVVTRILSHTDADTRRQINEILKYPKDSAGSVMTVEYVSVKKEMTVGEAIARIRRIALDRETVYTCYVTEHRVLIGVITIKEMLIAKDEQKIEDIMETNVISVITSDDKEDVAKIFRRYDFLAIPVVDREGCLVGIVTVDDALDVLEDEMTEDMSIMAAMAPSAERYFKTGVFKHARNRIVWLIILMFSAILTGSVISSYEKAFAAVPLLVAFVPMLMGVGGNCGSQSSTLIIRGIAIDEIHFKDIFRVMFKEFRVAILVGIGLALVNGVRVVIFYHDIRLALSVSISMIFIIVLAKLFGCTFPLLAKRVGLDPALLATPLISTVLDTCSLLIFFKIATMFFRL